MQHLKKRHLRIALLMVSVASVCLQSVWAKGVDLFNFSLVGGPLYSVSVGDASGKLGLLGGALLEFAPGKTGWEIEILGLSRNYETTSGGKLDSIFGQLGAMMRLYFSDEKNLSLGVGPYVGKQLRNAASIYSDQLEVGGAISLRYNLKLPIQFGPFGMGVLSGLRFNAGKVVSGEPRNTYVDVSFLAGLQFGFI